MTSTRQWNSYIGAPETAIPMDQWGTDHWSTFAYLETRAVDHAGIVDNRRMRTNPRLHRGLIGINGAFGPINIPGPFPRTRLKTGDMDNERHDDWSCLEDMVALGLLTAKVRLRDPDRFWGGDEVQVKFTRLGRRVSAQLRQHKMDGGKYANFIPTLPVTAS